MDNKRFRQLYIHDSAGDNTGVLTEEGEKHFLALAGWLAETGHKGQRYGDFPYMYHVYSVHAEVVHMGAHTRMVALMHDLLEDTHVTEQALRNFHRFPDAVIDAVKLLTRPEGVPYAEYVKAIAEGDSYPHKLAQSVKLADLKQNLANADGSNPGRVQRYHHAREIIRTRGRAAG